MKYLRLIILWTFTILTPFTWISTASVQAPDRISIDHRLPQETINRLDTIARRCEREIKQLLLNRDANIPIQFNARHVSPVLPQNPMIVDVGAALDTDEFVLRMIRGLLVRRMTELSTLDYSSIPEAPEWVVAGLYHRILSQNNPGVKSMIFPLCQALIESDSVPNMFTLINSPVSAHYPQEYRIYSELCDGILRIIELQMPADFMASYLEKLSTGSNPSTTVILDQLSALIPEPDLQHWYESQLRDIAFTFFSPCSPIEVARQLRGMITLSVIGKDEWHMITAVPIPIEDLDHYVADNKIGANDISEILTRLISLTNKSPQSLSTALMLYRQSLEKLISGPLSAYAGIINQANAEFAAGMKRGLEIAAYLDRIEEEQKLDLPILQNLLKTRQNSRQRYQLEKQQQINSYLDEFEKNLP